MIKQILGRLPRKTSKSSEWDSTSLASSSSSSFANGDISGRGTANAYKEEDNPGTNAGVTSASASIVSSKLLNGGSIPASYEVLPKFTDVSTSEKQNLFIEKLKLCCVVFDFTDPTKNLKEKDIKRETLLEILDYVQSATGTLLKDVMQDIINMVSTNLFRALPPPRKEPSLEDFECFDLEDFDLKEEEPTLEPSWPHLQVAYDILLGCVISFETDTRFARRYIDQSFVLKLLDLFDSENPKEREHLKIILHRIYGIYIVDRPFIRKAIDNIFYRFIFETEKHNGIAELLEILGSIINGFSLPLKEEHKLFLVRSLIPLHKPKSIVMYHQHLSYCITQFIEKDCQLADTVIRGLLKFWPITNSSKEVMFLGELEKILEATQPAEFQRCMVPLFWQIARCIDSPHFQVAEKALFLWNNDHIENLIKQNRKVILPIVFPALKGNSHWNPAVERLTLRVCKTFFYYDFDHFTLCSKKYDEHEAKKKELDLMREATWKRLEKIAASKAASFASSP